MNICKAYLSNSRAWCSRSTCLVGCKTQHHVGSCLGHCWRLVWRVWRNPLDGLGIPTNDWHRPWHRGSRFCVNRAWLFPGLAFWATLVHGPAVDRVLGWVARRMSRGVVLAQGKLLPDVLL